MMVISYTSIDKPIAYSHVSIVGIMAVNMRKSMQKKRHPELLKILLASLPML